MLHEVAHQQECRVVASCLLVQPHLQQRYLLLRALHHCFVYVGQWATGAPDLRCAGCLEGPAGMHALPSNAGAAPDSPLPHLLTPPLLSHPDHHPAASPVCLSL
eukprot:scaffold244226_cov19-Tisochrysis_lutea.AAC.1